ncbi:LapA family protein [Ramlibacter sp. G-1-2-2]|uniref:LapA family protein n=1 Tax=Ramlibacter agri TaxID=2728837 RepID=A0A848H9C2_9BURK|nr:LapA family protein [Ramlibacter agri]NML47094.1 LapA family protein [Ramlibacter agri]
MTRYLYIALAVVLVALVLLFKVQNTDSVTVSLFSMQATMPTSVMVLGVYVLGMFTGGFVLGFLRTLTHKATARGA